MVGKLLIETASGREETEAATLSSLWKLAFRLAFQIAEKNGSHLLEHTHRQLGVIIWINTSHPLTLALGWGQKSKYQFTLCSQSDAP